MRGLFHITLCHEWWGWAGLYVPKLFLQITEVLWNALLLFQDLGIPAHQPFQTRMRICNHVFYCRGKVSLWQFWTAFPFLLQMGLFVDKSQGCSSGNQGGHCSLGKSSPTMSQKPDAAMLDPPFHQVQVLDQFIQNGYSWTNDNHFYMESGQLNQGKRERFALLFCLYLWRMDIPFPVRSPRFIPGEAKAIKTIGILSRLLRQLFAVVAAAYILITASSLTLIVKTSIL